MKRLFIPILIAFAVPCRSQWRDGYMSENILAFGTHDSSLFIGIGPDAFVGDPLVWRLISLAPNVVWRYADTGMDRSQGSPSIFVSLGRYFFAAPFGHRIYSTTDEGSHWNPLNAASPFCSNGAYLFAQYYAPTALIRSSDSGKNWDSVANIGVVHFATVGACVIAGVAGGIWRSTNDGITWAYFTTPISGQMTVMDSLLFIVGNGQLAKSTDSGSRWSVVPVDSAGVPEAVSCLATDGKNLFAGTPAGVLVSTDIGQHWQAKDDGLTYHNISTMAVFDTFLFIEVSKISLNNYFHAYYRPISELTGPPDAVQLPPLNDTIEIYPNPASGMVSIRSGGTSILGITVLNVLGENMLSIPYSHSSDISLDLSKLPSGTYFLRIETPKGSVLRKVIRE